MRAMLADDRDREDVVVIGAGPSGLSAALALARGGATPLILERSAGVGGLMRAVRWGGFTVDLGRKELYARFPEVDELWSGLIGSDYAAYPHRVGSLYGGRIIELSGRHSGPMRGMPLGWLIGGGLSMGFGWIAAAVRRPSTYEGYWHARVGRRFARMMAQGYWEKFRGSRWADMPVPETDIDGRRSGSRSLQMVRDTLRLARRGGVSTQMAWRHPASGTGQLFEALHAEVAKAGARIRLNTRVTGLRSLEDGGFAIEFEGPEGPRQVKTRKLISSLPIEALAEILGLASPAAAGPADAERSVVLVYLFLDAPARFAHAWLEVNDPALAVGRVTNFAGFGGRMVPAGRSCLCAEYFCHAGSPVTKLDDDAISSMALRELSSARLVDPDRLLAAQVVRLARTNAAASWREQQSERRTGLVRQLARLPDLFHVNRPGSDWASLAGLLAGQAVLSGSRTEFDLRADPTRRHFEPVIGPDGGRIAVPQSDQSGRLASA